jgi:hypothetical protein
MAPLRGRHLGSLGHRRGSGGEVRGAGSDPPWWLTHDPSHQPELTEHLAS